MAFPSAFKFEKPKINPEEIPGRRELVQFFKDKNIEMYLEMFPKNVDFGFFKTMDEDDFTEYGVPTDSPAMRVLVDAVKIAVEEEEAEEAKEEEKKQQEEKQRKVGYN